MLQGLAFGLGVGAAVQAWRNFPADGRLQGDSLALVFCIGIVCAYLGGRWRSRGGSATATATATATASSDASSVAQNQVNVAFVVPGGGARPVGVGFPSENAPWMVGAEDRPALSLDELDGQDLADFAEEVERDHA